MKNQEQLAVPSGAETYSAAMEHAHNYTNWIVDQIRPYLGRSLLEIGVGHGAYADHLPKVEKFIGIDIDEQSVAEARLRHPEHEFLLCDIADESAVPRLQPKGIDTIICCNVLEHIEDDRLAVNNLIDVLAPGGAIFLFVPALGALYSDLDRLAGHHRRYNLDHLTRLLDKRCRIERSYYFNAIGGLGWWANKLFKRSSLNDPAINNQILLFDKYVIPAARGLDVLFKGWFGQSAICIARKL